jgi:hypothetical protein
MKNLRHKYWLFVYDNYYPSGGMRDLKLTSNDIDSFITIIYEIESDGFQTKSFHVLDSETGKAVDYKYHCCDEYVGFDNVD